jgi:DNA replication protein DnaC
MTDLVLTETNIPSLFRRTTFDDFDPTRLDHGEEILREIQEWEPTDSHPFLLMWGAPNVGKTMLAAALANDYHSQYPVRRATNEKTRLAIRQDICPVYFIQVAEYISLQLRSMKLFDLVKMGSTDAAEYLETDRLLQDLHSRVKVLVLDDVGKEHRTGTNWSTDTFDLLVRTRHNQGLTTIYTSNLPPKRWADVYSDSMRSLIERSSLVLHF